ncbi:true, partial [Symbiodinium necroappetens]
QKRIDNKEVWLRRARLVAREFAFLEPHREGLFSPASSAIVTRLIPHLFIQQRSLGWSMMAVDIADAYLTCSQGEPTITSVKLGDATLWFRLDKCLPGQRDGSSRWFGEFSSYLHEHCNTEQMPQMTSILRFPEKQGAGLLHVDDLLAAGVTSILEGCCSQLSRKYKISVQWIRSPGDELNFLKKRHVLISDGELSIEVHGKHLDRLLEITGLALSKGRSRQSPMPTGNLPTEQEDDPLLDSDQGSKFRTCVGILLYLQADIPEAQFAIRYLASYMSKPTRGSWSLLRHLTGYLHQHQSQCQCVSSSAVGQGLIVRNEGKHEAQHLVEAFSDADWAGCKKTRKSVSGSAFLVNSQLVYSASRTQRLIALSSAESEYHAAISCAIDGLLIRAVVEFLYQGEVAPLRVLVDNQAFLVALQTARSLGGSDDEQDDGSNEPTAWELFLSVMMQFFGYVAAFMEAYPAALSAAAQVAVICIVLCFASCIFRRDPQPTVNVHIGGVTVSGTPSVPQDYTSTSSQEPPSAGCSSAEESFDAEAWITEAAREARMQSQAKLRGASSKAKSSPQSEKRNERLHMPGSSNDHKQLPKDVVIIGSDVASCTVPTMW